MKIQKKHIIAGAIGVVTILGALAYLQYKKLMNYTIGFKGIKIKKISASLIDLELFISFMNNSDVKFDIVEQIYKVYMNDKFVTKLSNDVSTTILPKSPSVFPINVKFNPTEVLSVLKLNAVAILSKPDTIILTIETKLKVSLYGIKVSIPYTYKGTLKEMMTTTPTT
jgi:LEA14-like dessication related protein